MKVYICVLPNCQLSIVLFNNRLLLLSSFEVAYICLENIKYTYLYFFSFQFQQTNMQEQDFDAYDIHLVKRLRKQNEAAAANENSPIYIMSKWKRGLAKEDEPDTKIPLVLQTLDDGKCYCGELSIMEMEKAAGELNIDVQMFIGESRMALSANNDSDTVALFDFELQQEDGKMLFVVTKQCMKLRLRYIEVELTQQSNNAAMLDALMALVQYLPYSTHLQQNSVEPEPAIDMTKVVEQCVSAQEQLKQEMLTKFCVLLNSKKRKICELQEQLKKMKATDKEEPDEVDPAKGIIYTDEDIFEADTQPMTIN